MSRTVLVTLAILVLYQLSSAESVAISIHAGKGFQENDIAVIASAESIVGPSVLEVSAMFMGNPLAAPRPEHTTIKSVNVIPRIIIGYPAFRISAGVGCGIATVETKESRQSGPLFLGVSEVRVFLKKGVGVSGRVMMVRTRFPGGRYDVATLEPYLDVGSGLLYTVGFIAGLF